MSQLRQKIVASEAALSEHACCIRRLEDQITLKRQQVCQLRSQFTAREEALRAAPAPDAVDVLRNQLQSAQECVKAKTEELEKLREECGAHDATIKRLEEQLRQAKVVQENSEVCSDVSQLSEQVRSWRAQLADSASRVYALEGQLDAARRRCRRYELSYREEAECAARLQAELAEATERGAELCEEARRLASALRGWARRLRDTHVDQQRRLREQETELHQLRQRLLAAPVTRSQSCSRSELAPTRASQRTTKIGFDQRCGRRAMDARSCSSSPASRFTSASASPLICRRQTRHSNVPSLPRGESPAEVLMSRVEHLSAALDSGRQRWARASPRPHTSR
ncbi:hypothetical protein EVAR_71502_1 [Eumeta japonica]|uniref:Uncharacterized protein n=1 Tax=Eumeta variegata TaxID=151549 RepID=A0A4C2AAD1_EUMVA|nr:hypothetical protein EVAR_71502_1 [Eumeta japonica]